MQLLVCFIRLLLLHVAPTLVVATVRVLWKLHTKAVVFVWQQLIISAHLLSKCLAQAVLEPEWAMMMVVVSQPTAQLASNVIVSWKFVWNVNLELSKVEITMYNVSVVTNNKKPRRDMTFIRIGTKSISYYIKAAAQYNLHVLLLLIKMRQLSRIFLNSISVYILETINWYVNESVYVPVIL